ncbi:hypothetical protein PJP10_31685, partial [Mycobacterium kansasii]
MPIQIPPVLHFFVVLTVDGNGLGWTVGIFSLTWDFWSVTGAQARLSEFCMEVWLDPSSMAVYDGLG